MIVESIISFTAEKWFEPKPFESESFYRHIGIRVIKKYFPTTGDLMLKHVWRPLSLVGNFSSRNKDQMEMFSKTTKILEVLHGGAFLFLLSPVPSAIAHEDFLLATLELGFNTAVNLCPILVQRYNRLRINRVLNRLY